jgi:hypothetical protein
VPFAVAATAIVALPLVTGLAAFFAGDTDFAVEARSEEELPLAADAAVPFVFAVADSLRAALIFGASLAVAAVFASAFTLALALAGDFVSVSVAAAFGRPALVAAGDFALAEAFAAALARRA